MFAQKGLYLILRSRCAVSLQCALGETALGQLGREGLVKRKGDLGVHMPEPQKVSQKLHRAEDLGALSPVAFLGDNPSSFKKL